MVRNAFLFFCRIFLVVLILTQTINGAKMANSSASGPSTQERKINIVSSIDHLTWGHFQKDSFRFENIFGAAPGRHNGTNLPTYVNGVSWIPTWPPTPPSIPPNSIQARDVAYNETSSVSTGITPAVPDGVVTAYWVDVNSGRDAHRTRVVIPE